MKARKKVAIYIDYTIRVPRFKHCFDVFKAELFSDKSFDVTVEDELQKDDVRMYWPEQMKNPAVEQFYMKVKVPEDDYTHRLDGFAKYFYNEEHYRKFIDDYSYNLYLDCIVPNKQDIDIINIAQEHLFDVVLIDEYKSKRKKGNTFFFLSKNPIYPQTVTFLGPGQVLDETNYFGVWNPAKNEEQKNAQGLTMFKDWFMELEKKSKENGE